MCYWQIVLTKKMCKSVTTIASGKFLFSGDERFVEIGLVSYVYFAWWFSQLD